MYTAIVMIELEHVQTVPLIVGEDGTIRITGSRVTLDSLVDEFKLGATAEQIQEDFPSLTLREVYGAISYYLEHEETVEEYLRNQEQDSQETRQFVESRQDSASLRERIRARRVQALD
jgi:uncharacterized protein (DUF433 family)